MTTNHSIPPLRELPTGRLAERKQHLLAEITREGEPRLSLPSFSFPRVRLTALAGAGACVAAGVATLVIVLTGGSGARQSPFLVQATRGPAWSAATGGVNWGGGVTSLGSTVECNAMQVLLGCKGSITMPGARVAPPAAITPAGSSAPASATTEIVGGTAGEQTLLRTIIAAMQPTVIEKIEIVGNSNDIALHMTAPDTSMRTLWEESLVAAAFRDRANEAGDNLSVSLFDGARNGGPFPPGPATPLPSAKPSDAAAAKQRFEQAAAKIGVPLDELTVYQPDGLAVAATLKSDDPASFLRHQMPTFLAALGNRWTDYDGTYIRVVDQNGATVWESSTNGRIASGSVGFRQDLAGCSPVVDWGPTPPPCAAK